MYRRFIDQELVIVPQIWYECVFYIYMLFIFVTLAYQPSLFITFGNSHFSLISFIIIIIIIIIIVVVVVVAVALQLWLVFIVT